MVLGIVALVSIAVMGFAATQDKTVGGTTGYPANVRGKTFLLERTLDFSSSSHTGTASDVYQMINIPAGTHVLAAGFEVETVEDSACTVDLGDGDNTVGYALNVGVTNGGTTYAWSQSTTNAYEKGVLYTSADTIDLVLDNNADTLKITVRALCVPVGGTE